MSKELVASHCKILPSGEHFAGLPRRVGAVSWTLRVDFFLADLKPKKSSTQTNSLQDRP